MTAFREWCTAMTDSAEGRVFLGNMLYDCVNRRIPTSIVCFFHEKISHHWRNREPLDRPDEVVLPRVREELDLKGSFCQGINVPDNPRRCSRVVIVDGFFKHNLDWARLGYIVTGRVSTRQAKRLEREGFRGCQKNEIRGSRPFAWVTKTDELDGIFSRERIRDRSRPFANIARKWLGLNHLEKDQHLIEVQYPEDQMLNAELKKPTFIEGDSLVYCSRDGRDGWGIAVKLDDMSDGLTEAVHPAITCDGRSQIRDLGRLRPFAYAVDWEELIRNQPLPWSIDSVLTIERILCHYY